MLTRLLVVIILLVILDILLKTFYGISLIGFIFEFLRALSQATPPSA